MKGNEPMKKKFFVTYCSYFDMKDNYECSFWCMDRDDAYLTAHREKPENYFVLKITEV